MVKRGDIHLLLYNEAKVYSTIMVFKRVVLVEATG